MSVNGRGGSLRDLTGQREPPRPAPLDSEIDRIFREAAQAQRAPQTDRKDTTVEQPLADIHGPRDVARRIKALQAEGVTQLTDAAAIKAMKPAQIVEAQRAGRLLTYMTGIGAADENG